jgi:methionyl-tRNA synthetase
MDGNLLHQGIGTAVELASTANGFVETRAPWTQAKDPAQAADLDDTLHDLARVVSVLTTMLSPFMPSKMTDLAGNRVSRGDVLFPKLG